MSLYVFFACAMCITDRLLQTFISVFLDQHLQNSEKQQIGTPLVHPSKTGHMR